MSFFLPQLPYARNALAPYISSETIDYHYGKHHQTYVDNLNNLTKDTQLADKTLLEVIKAAESGSAIFNNAAQVWNHSFYWQCLCPPIVASADVIAAAVIKAVKANVLTIAELVVALERDFGSVEQFKELFAKTAISLFGSGWVWLVKDKASSKLEVMHTANAQTPVAVAATAGEKIALLVCDVWEHAYYIDYRNARAKYIDAFWHLVNWDFVCSNLKLIANS